MRVRLAASFGQMLLEVVIALMVAVVAIIALVSVATKGVTDATLSENRNVAARYAQEGFEQVRIVRDRQGWEVFSQYSTSAGDNCYKVNTTNWTLERINCSDYVLLSNPIFSRKITLTGDGDLLRIVRVEVKWTDSSGEQKSVVESKLTKWKEPGIAP